MGPAGPPKSMKTRPSSRPMWRGRVFEAAEPLSARPITTRQHCRANAGDGARRQRLQRIPEDQAPHPAGRCAERHADPDFRVRRVTSRESTQHQPAVDNTSPRIPMAANSVVLILRRTNSRLVASRVVRTSARRDWSYSAIIRRTALIEADGPDAVRIWRNGERAVASVLRNRTRTCCRPPRPRSRSTALHLRLAEGAPACRWHPRLGRTASRTSR